MAELPSGTVTFLFTDLEGSTRLWEQHSEAMKHALARHDAILRAAVDAHHGHVVKTTGDGFHAVFVTAHDAVSAAISAQLALDNEVWGPTGPLVVRMGLHTGEADYRDGDYYGPSVNRAARLMSVAHGGQVVLSLVTAELSRGDLPVEVGFIDLGEHRLADLAHSERVFQVVHPELRDAFPPLRSLSAHHHNLPIAPNHFVGRERELETVTDLLRSARLVTLAGVGGVGKSRLALQVAAGLLEAYSDGIFIVALAPLTDPALVVAEVMRELRLLEGQVGDSPASLLEALCAHLRGRRVLLLLDNCEHLIGEVARFCETLLRECSGVVILTTSREPLSIAGEVVWRVPPLAVPPDEPGLSSAIYGSDAVSLFCERARAADADLQLSSENASVVAGICRRLDGLPLALELAAARLRVLTPQQLADRLDERFQLLTDGPRTASSRQQTLRAAMDWSYELLSDGERTLLQCISVFAGNFGLGAAEAVASDGRIVGRSDVLDLIARLVDKSLVGVDRSSSEARYWLLETVREYAAEKLTEAGTADETRQRHCDYFVALAEAYLGPDPMAVETKWLARLRLEHDNLRAALDWSLARGDAERALLLTAMIGFYWTLAGHLVEGRTRLERALALQSATAMPARARTMNALGFLLAHQGDISGSEVLHREAARFARNIGDVHEAGLSEFYLGARLLHEGHLEQAKRLLEEARDDLRAARSETDNAARYGADPPLLGPGIGWCEFMLAWISLARANTEGATTHLREALELARCEQSDNLGAHALAALASLAALNGDRQAHAVAEQGIEAARRLGLAMLLVMTLTRAVEVDILLGRWADAKTALSESLGILRDTGARGWLADSLEMTAVVLEARGSCRPAACVLGASRGVREASGELADVRAISVEVQHCLERLEQSLGADELATQCAEGHDMSPAVAVDYALEQLGTDDPQRVAHVVVASHPSPGSFSRHDKRWVIGYRQSQFELVDMKGLHYLARLLSQPDREVHVLDLVGADALGSRRRADRGDAGPVLDDQAKAAYRRRIHELQEEIDEARTWNDGERAARAELELDAVTRQLAAAVGVGGRDRRAASAAERARVSVRKAIASAINRITEQDLDLGLLLSTTVKTGTYCRYAPDPRLPVAWTVTSDWP